MGESARDLLKRVSLPEDAANVSSWGSTPEAALSTIGYNVFHEHQGYLLVMQALDRMQWLPFSPASVEEYELQIGKGAGAVEWFWYNVRKITSVLTILGLFLCFGPALLGWLISWKIGLGFVVAMIACAGIGIAILPKGGYTKYPSRWNLIPIGNYTRPIPRHILEHANHWKGGCSGDRYAKIELFVREFVRDGQFCTALLLARFSSMDHYIAAWDEAAFESEQYT